MARYRKKPVVIEAVQWDGTDAHEAVGRYLATPEGVEQYSEFMASSWAELGTPFFAIQTDAGLMQLSEGDWIIKGVKGEFYPCKPDIFAETYEEVSE
jgi:hypothetical protein